MMMKEFKALSENDLSKVNGGIGGGVQIQEVTAQVGDTLEKIAQRYNATVAMLRQLNPGLTGNPQPGTKIKVPAV